MNFIIGDSPFTIFPVYVEVAMSNDGITKIFKNTIEKSLTYTTGDDYLRIASDTIAFTKTLRNSQ